MPCWMEPACTELQEPIVKVPGIFISQLLDIAIKKSNYINLKLNELFEKMQVSMLKTFHFPMILLYFTCLCS